MLSSVRSIEMLIVMSMMKRRPDGMLDLYSRGEAFQPSFQPGEILDKCILRKQFVYLSGNFKELKVLILTYIPG